MKFHHTAFAHLKEGWKRTKKPILITTGVTALVVLIVVGGSYAYLTAYDGKIYQNITVGISGAPGFDISGLTEAEASQKIQEAYESMLNKGLPVRLITEDENRLAVIDLRASGSTDPDLVYDLININVDQITKQAFSYAREYNNPILDTWSAFKILAFGAQVYPQTTIAMDQIEEAIRQEFGDVEDPGEKTDYVIENEDDELVISVIEGTKGNELDTRSVVARLVNDVLDFDLEEKTLELVEMDDIIATEQAETMIEEVESIIESAPYKLTYTAETQIDYDWTIDDEDIADWILPVNNEEGDLTLTLDLENENMIEFLDEIKEDVDVKPQNARFQVEGERVTEFAGSLDGVTLDEETTFAALNELLGKEDVELEITVATVEPEITTDSVNGLGISEILGVGVSDFSGSPSNRISNIKHGANKLNGLLIAPDEEFSLIEALSPFTIADGWRSELVIVGDEIKPEVGGGACQFGTTLFRASMNSGLEITQRRNHSLVVSYYDDPSNGNPGTDATIYDPAPDYRFKNDTGNYLLLTTDVNVSTGQMVFTFWGTSDGRTGYYTPPQVLSWSGYGATVEKETDTLAPGVRRCQAPHSGATTSFDYIVEYADGEVFEHTYTSIYRSLPTICLVGKGGGDSGSDDVVVDPDEPLEVDDPPAVIDDAPPIELDDVSTE